MANNKYSELPTLLINIKNRKPEKINWIGVSFGLNLNLYRFWKKNGYKCVYLRQNINGITGEYTTVMIKPFLNELNNIKNDWIDQFYDDFKKRFINLLSYEFRNLDIITGLSVFDPCQSLLENNKLKIDNKNNYINYHGLKKIFSDWDLKRLDTYNKNLVNYQLILDLIPYFADLFFKKKLDCQLNYTQCCVLLGMGLQRKQVNDIKNDLNIQQHQCISILNKCIKKLYHCVQQIVRNYVEKNEIFNKKDKKNAEKTLNQINTNTMSDPMVRMRDSLMYEGKKIKRNELKQKKNELKTINNELKEQKKNEEKQKNKILRNISEYNIDDKLISEDIDIIENDNNKIPNVIQIKVGEKLIENKKSGINEKIDPNDLITKDKAFGINPNSKYHWNKNKKKNRRGKKRTKILEHHKKKKDLKPFRKDEKYFVK